MTKETYKELVYIGNRIEDLSTRYDKLIDSVDEEEDEYIELDEHDLIDHIEILYNNGLGTAKIHDLIRLIFLKDGDLARQMCKELLYWIENEPNNNKSNI